MANVLSVLERASDEDIRNQVAMLEVVTIKNIMNTEGKKMADKAAGAVNTVSRLFGRKKQLIKELKPKSIDEQIKDKIEEHAYDSRVDLDVELRKLLAERLNLKGDPSDERIAKELVSKAAKHMDIDEVLAPAEKIDAVFQRYMERLEKKMREAYDKADEVTKEKLRQKIEESLDAMTEEQRGEVRKALKTDKVTADTVISMMKTTGITGIMAAMGSVFGSYLLLSIIIHGVFTTLLGVTVPFAVYTGAASTLSIITGPLGWAALAAFGIWQYMKGTSKVDGEIYCQLVFVARFLNRRRFAPEDDDLPNWIIGRDEETRREIEESDASYREREEELKKARAARDEAEKKFREAQRSEEAARGELEKQKQYIAEIQAQVEAYDSNKQRMENELKVLEERLLLAAEADKQSTLTINTLKHKILQQKENIATLQETHAKNLATLKNAPVKELEIKQLIEEAEAESERELASTQEAEQACDASREVRDAAREQRIESIGQGIKEWIQQEYAGKTCELDEVILSQLAMSNNEHNKAVLKVMKQVLDAESSEDLGDRVSEGSFKLPIGGTGMFLVYEANNEGKIRFLKFTDSESLSELQKEREEKRQLKHAISQMKEDMDEAMRKVAEQADNKIIRDSQIRNWFDRALNETQEELDILSPWMSYSVVNNRFYKKIERLLEAGVVVKILYGIQEWSKGNGVDQKTKDVAKDMEQRFSKYRNFHMEETNSHGKMLLCDNRFYLMASYNFLSFAGDYRRAHTRGETGICSENVRNIEELRGEYFMF